MNTQIVLHLIALRESLARVETILIGMMLTQVPEQDRDAVLEELHKALSTLKV